MARQLLRSNPRMAKRTRKAAVVKSGRGASLARQATRRSARQAARRARRANGGFTLVELAIVVAIVGVLSVLAVVGYRKLTLSSKVSEATGMVAAIRVAQEDYRAEKGSYASIGTNWCPSDGSQQKKFAWDTGCAGGTASWSALPVHVDGPVQFGYRVAAGANTVVDPFTTGIDFSGADPRSPWYIIHARADLNNDGNLFTEVAASSFNNQIVTRNDGD